MIDRSERAYQELRAVAEDLLRAPPGQQRARLRAALTEALRLHCRQCGDLIDREPRGEGEEFCYACAPPVDLARDLKALDDD